MENIVFDLVKSGIAVELLVPTDAPDVTDVGVRLRTFGKSLPKDRMVLGVGATFSEALDDAVDKASRKRWEHLNWSARPWKRPEGYNLNQNERWGLV